MRFGLMLPSQATGSRRQVAAQTIFHDQRYPSHILLPLIPRSGPPMKSTRAARGDRHVGRLKVGNLAIGVGSPRRLRGP
jgi:hypothetical protein